MMRWAILVVLVLASAVWGNGIKFPEAGFPVPSVPGQRALIVHREGRETLVVESSYETASPEVGWVLPLPAEPERLEVAEPGGLASLSTCVRPRVMHDLSAYSQGPKWLLALLAPLACVMITVAPPRGCAVGIVIALFLVLASLMLPALNATKGFGDMAAGVSVSSVQEVGGYTASILRAESAEALSGWLREQGLMALPEKAGPIVEDYIARGWCFLVAHLRREGEGVARPHPMSVTFAAEKPVYPMRLTSLAPGKTAVELVVVSDRQASAEPMQLIAADRYRLEPEEEAQYGRWGACYRAAETGLVIGHPDVVSRMWDGCVVTKLTGELSGEQMGRDMELALGEVRPFRQRIYSAQGRKGVAAAVAWWGAVVFVAVSGVVFQRGRRSRNWERVAVASVGVLTLLGVVAVYAVVPVSEVKSGRQFSERFEGYRMRRLAAVASELIVEGRLAAVDRLARFPEIAVEEQAIDRKILINPLTGRPMRNRRAAGDFAVREIEGKRYVCFYDLDACEYRVEVGGGRMMKAE